MAKITVISATKNFIVSSLIKQLEKSEYDVYYQGGLDSKSIADMETDMVIMYAEDGLIKKQELINLKDEAIKQNIPIYLLGDLDLVDKVEDIISSEYIKEKFLRPINLKDVVDAIDRVLCVEKKIDKKKILVVDDSGAMLRNIKGWLEDKYQVILANSGTMAIKYLAMNQPDLVLLDYEMPVCNGKQVLEMIRSENDFSDVPVMFLTSKNDKATVMEILEMKIEGYLLKTMEPTKIVEKIDEFFIKNKH